jgi:transcriptional regulator GlxA family with amidase domain
MLANVSCVVDTWGHPFELGVAAEVFGTDRSDQGLPNFDFAVCSAVTGPIRASGGMSISPAYDLDRVAEADLVVVAAWQTDPGTADPAVAAALHEAVGHGATVLSLCSGAFLLAELGLLDGRTATCHWLHQEKFRARFPHVNLEPDRLYVEDGPIITSAGTAAGIDACLHLIRREYGAKIAAGFARRMVVSPYREGGQSQFIDNPVPPATDTSQTMPEILEWMQSHLAMREDVAALAVRAHMSPRTFARRFVAATGTTPYEWLTRQRVFWAQQLLEGRSHTIEQIASHTGFSTAETLRHHFTRQLGTTPTSYRARFCQPAPA